MIESYQRGKNPILNYSKEISFLNKKINFKSGINIIIGGNGTGKTTLIESIAKLFFAYDFGFTDFIGFSDFSYLFEVLENKIKFSDKIIHNDAPLVFNNKVERRYLMEKNIEIQLNRLLGEANKSEGEIEKFSFNLLIENINSLCEIESLKENFKKNVNDIYKQKIDSWYNDWFIPGNLLDNKIITILLDEPTSKLDLKNKISFWNHVKNINKNNFQIIIATHDIIPFFLYDKEDYNLIETELNFFNNYIKSICLDNNFKEQI